MALLEKVKIKVFRKIIENNLLVKFKITNKNNIFFIYNLKGLG
jgi:hypothetical protein